MIVVMKTNARKEHVSAIIKRVESAGCKVHPIIGAERTVIGVIGDGTAIDKRQIVLYLWIVAVLVPQRGAREYD